MFKVRPKIIVFAVLACIGALLWCSNAAGVIQFQTQTVIGDRIIGGGFSLGTQVVVPQVEVGKMPKADKA